MLSQVHKLLKNKCIMSCYIECVCHVKLKLSTKEQTSYLGILSYKGYIMTPIIDIQMNCELGSEG